MAPGVFVIVLLAGILTAGFVSLARIITESQTRRHLVERGLSAEEIRLLLQRPEGVGYGTLRAALLLLTVGGALMIAQYLPFDSRDPFVYGMVIFAGGLGLLLYQLTRPLLRRRQVERGGEWRNG